MLKIKNILGNLKVLINFIFLNSIFFNQIAIGILLLGSLTGLLSQTVDQTATAAAAIVTSTSEELLILGIPFDCTGKATGFYKDPKFCDIFHVCVNFQQRKTYGCPQVGDQFFYDDNLKMCEFTSRNPKGCSSNEYYQQVVTTPQSVAQGQAYTPEPTTPWKEFTRQIDQFSCSGKADGFYSSRWCNVFYRCSSGTRFEFLCAKQQNGDHLWYSKNSDSQATPDAEGQCSFPCDLKRECVSPGGILFENGTVVSESINEVKRIKDSCTKVVADSSSVDHSNDVFRLPVVDQGETSCKGKPDGSFQGDEKYCNVFHVCYAGTKRDFLCPKAINSEYELWWDETRNRCDWPCKIKCNKEVFGGSKGSSEIQQIDRLINAAECQVTVKSFKYTFFNRAYNQK